MPSELTPEEVSKIERRASLVGASFGYYESEVIQNLIYTLRLAWEKSGNVEGRMNIKQLEESLAGEDSDHIRIRPDGTVLKLTEIEHLRERLVFEHDRVELLQHIIDDVRAKVNVLCEVLPKEAENDSNI